MAHSHTQSMLLYNVIKYSPNYYVSIFAIQHLWLCQSLGMEMHQLKEHTELYQQNKIDQNSSF